MVRNVQIMADLRQKQIDYCRGKYVEIEHLIAKESDPDTGKMLGLIAGLKDFMNVHFITAEMIGAEQGDIDTLQHRVYLAAALYWYRQHKETENREPGICACQLAVFYIMANATKDELDITEQYLLDFIGRMR
jgi:hypothetical protein